MAEVTTIRVERVRIVPLRRPAGRSAAWHYLYSARGPDTIRVGERELPRQFDNRSIATLRGVLRKAYGPDVQIIETWKE